MQLTDWCFPEIEGEGWEKWVEYKFIYLFI